MKKLGSFKRMLETGAEALYWVGFVLADGHFTVSQKRFSITLATKDRCHLLKLASFLGRDSLSNENLIHYYHLS